MGMTHIRLAAASEDVLTGALHAPWKLRVEKNAQSGVKRGTAVKTGAASQSKNKARAKAVRKSPVKARRKKS
jgi:hypothetical protein